MSKRKSRSMQITLAFAATLAVLGASIGAPAALAQSETYGGTKLNPQPEPPKPPLPDPARGRMLNPQPQPPKSRNGAYTGGVTRPSASMRDPGPVGRTRLKNPGPIGRRGLKDPGPPSRGGRVPAIQTTR